MTGLAEQAIELETVSRTTRGGTLRRQVKSASEIASPKVQFGSLLLIALSLGWLFALVAAECLKETLPWALTFSLVGGVTIAMTYGSKWVAPINLFRIGENRWTSMPGGLAATGSVLTAVAGIFLLLHHFVPDHSMQANRQVIEIELVSPHDFEDHKDIAPSTEKKLPVTAAEVKPKTLATAPTERPAPHPVLFKHTANIIASQHLQPMPMAEAAQIKTAPAEQTFVIRQQPNLSGLGAPASPKTNVPKQKVVPHKAVNTGPLMEEVAPAQLMEVTENQEDKDGEASQSGGHSRGGTGAQALMVTYLNDLHRRIKHAWIPPANETHSAKIMFRIRKSGRLVSIKLVTSSGELATDQSAMHAVVACTPFKPLPDDYPADALDLLYTFNYHLDQLSEIGNSSSESTY